MRVAVLMGGNSSEREVSLVTGRAVSKALEKMGMEVVPCPYEGDISAVLTVLMGVDLVFNALHGGEGENGTVQRILQDHQIRYTGSGPEASSLAMDKQRTKQLLKESGLPTPAWIHIRKGSKEQVDLSAKRFTYPVVVKPNADGSTMGVTIVRSPDDLGGAIQLAHEFGPEILVEEYIPGREITVGILGDEALPTVEIIPSHELYDYACKYTEGMSRYVCPADIPVDLGRKIADVAEKVAKLLKCRHYCRADFRLNPDGEFFCLEVNTLPGMTSTSLVPKAARAAGIQFEDLVNKIVEFAASD